MESWPRSLTTTALVRRVPSTTTSPLRPISIPWDLTPHCRASHSYGSTVSTLNVLDCSEGGKDFHLTVIPRWPHLLLVLTLGWIVEVEVEVNLRPTVSRPDKCFFLLEISFRQLRVRYFVAPSLTRRWVCNLTLQLRFWALPEQSLLGRSLAELTVIFYCLVWESHNLEGQKDKLQWKKKFIHLIGYRTREISTLTTTLPRLSSPPPPQQQALEAYRVVRC
jgi:hypothetical protein